jgi:hypothetical protein
MLDPQFGDRSGGRGEYVALDRRLQARRGLHVEIGGDVD